MFTGQERLQTKRKLALIMKSQSFCGVYEVPVIMVEAFTKTAMNKSGIWLDARILLFLKNEFFTIDISGKAGKKSNDCI